MGSSKAADQLILAGAQSELAGGGGIGSADSDMEEQGLQSTMNQGLMESRRRAVLSPGGYISEGGLSAEGYDPEKMNAAGKPAQQRAMVGGAQGLEAAGRNAATATATPAYVPARTEYDQYGAKEVPAVGTPPAAASGTKNRYPGVKVPTLAGTPGPNDLSLLNAGVPAGGAAAPAGGAAAGGAPAAAGGTPKSAQDLRLEKLQDDTLKQVLSAGSGTAERESALEAINKKRYEEGKGAVKLDWEKIKADESAKRNANMEASGNAARFNYLAQNAAGQNAQPKPLEQAGPPASAKPPAATGETPAPVKPSAVSQPAMYQLGAGIRGALGAIPSGPEIMGATQSALSSATGGIAKAAESAVLGVGKATDEFKSGLFNQQSQESRLLELRKKAQNQ